MIMNYNGLYTMKSFVRKYLDPNKKLKILEVGSMDVMAHKNMIFRRYFTNKNWEFVGLDIEQGKNVDIVSKDLYNYPFPDNCFNVVISGSTLEHVEDIYKFIGEISRIAKDLVFVIAPNSCPYHAYPIDCWRIYPDGMRFLLEKIGGLNVLECKVVKNDTFGIAKKTIDN